MQFEWDEDKLAKNLAKHKISFEEVIPAFFDERAVYYEDTREEYGEQRMVLIGATHNRVVYVAFVELQEDTIKLISARKAEPPEIRAYQRGYR